MEFRPPDEVSRVSGRGRTPWAIWTLFALFLFPFLLAYVTVPQLNSAYSQAGAWVVSPCGGMWSRLGNRSGSVRPGGGSDRHRSYAVLRCFGFVSCVGQSDSPSSDCTPGSKSSARLVWQLISGVALVLVGVSICAASGAENEKLRWVRQSARTSATRGLVFCALSGVLASLMNFGLAFGGPILEAAQKNGAPKLWFWNANLLPFDVGRGMCPTWRFSFT